MQVTDSEQNNITELLTKCEGSLHAKDFEEAINGCRAILTISPDNRRARELMDEAQSKLEAELFTRENLRKAQEFFATRNFQKCINECQKIQLLDPDNAIVSELMTSAQAKLEAEPFVQNFISSGRSLFESGLYSEAIAQWEKVRAIDPAYPDLDRLIGNAKSRMDMTGVGAEATMRMFDAPEEAAVEGAEPFGFVSDQDRVQQLLEEGEQLYQSGQYQKAIEALSEIFMLDVNHPEALQKIEAARAAANEQRLRIKDDLKKAQQTYEQGDVAAAHELFKQVAAIDPENSEAQKYLALIGRSEGEPAGLDDLIAQGSEAEKNGQYRQAAQYFSQALAVDPENAGLADRIKNLNLQAKRQEQNKTLLGNARAFVAEGKVESARHALSKVLEADPSSQEALDLLRELKELPAGAPGVAQRGARVAVSARKAGGAKGFPMIPVAIGSLLIVAFGSAGYFFFRDKGNDPDHRPAISRTGKPPSDPSTRPNTKPGSANASTSQKKPAVPINEDSIQKMDRLLREANFYYREKQYTEAIAKADEILKTDPSNKDAIGLKLQARKMIADLQASERKILDDANTYFTYSDYVGAVKLYEKYIELHPDQKQELQPRVLMCYYNLGVLAIREWRCDRAGDYFRQVLFIDETDRLSQEALGIARRCQRSGASDIEVRKAVALMEVRR